MRVYNYRLYREDSETLGLTAFYQTISSRESILFRTTLRFLEEGGTLLIESIKEYKQ